MLLSWETTFKKRSRRDFFHYFSYRPKNPFYCDRSPLSSQQIADFNKQLPPHLQGYLTWREQYPGIGRYIPKNYMRVDNW
ncbi:hypothetical protein [Pseudanabaena sp. PCC 6802]|uniref:hypothetical protein n=1 Tax=Pseudanabaena sp. PCC 6802 TaxID=118173 RepID=UPI00034D852A|nr:hypothetical protein [Pseudanabaena sp. PCC 6802]